MKINIEQNKGLGMIGWIISIPLLLIGLLILVVIFFEGRKAYWDNKVMELCKEKGGMTVFEKVHLSEDEYKIIRGEQGTVHIPLEKYKKDFPYFARTVRQVIHEWDPEVIKRTTEIIRNSDGKVLGKYIRYSRIGGNIALIAHPSSFSCRDIEGFETDITRKIFIIDGESR